MRTLLTTFLLTCLFCGCQRSKNEFDRHGQITKIAFATGYCHGTCPYQAIEIDSSLTYKYYGGEWAKNKGYFTGTIDRGFWDSLNTDLKDLEYWNFEAVYDNTVDDQEVELIIFKGHDKKHIRGQYESLPKGLRDLFFKTYKSVARANLRPIKDSIAFVTTLQTPMKFPGYPKFLPETYKRATPKTGL
ncbi:DUF6438 domain-containing protein [Pedobacter sp. P351]|uniref:DUF6438 domain-containing protein n=1 Tax=Pedobacter superstes TaxID=3133441 RepID=UPI0030A56833